MKKFVPLRGSQRALLPKSTPAGAINRSEIASLTLVVRSKGDLSALEKKVHEDAAKSLDTRTYLTREQLAKSHGADPADFNAVEKVAQEHDLTVVRRSPAERSIVVRGKLGDLLAAFPADVAMYHHPQGTYRGRRGEIQIPQELDHVVTGVFGFDTRPRHRHNRALRMALAAKGPGGQNGEAATFFASRYHFPTTAGSTKLDGTGQTIGIIELGGGFRTSDLKAYFTEIKVPLPHVVSVSVDGQRSAPTTPDSDDGEVMLDIEVAGAVAPKAKIVVYFAPNNGDQGFLDAFSAAIHDQNHHPDVLSVSWGGPETSTDAQGNAAFHALFVQAAALGVTICTAAGDHGTADLDAQDWDGKIHVDHPSVDDLVLACGGTQIDAGVDVVWNDGTPFDVNTPGGGGWATGGGISVTVAQPAYQHQAGIKTVSIDTGKTGRGVPDIAMSATNYFTRVDKAEGASGGTSAVAPLMAGLVALLNQGKQKNVGFLNPFLYATKGVTTDVVTGSNAIRGSTKGYEAGAGWDACSGLGTPIGTAILTKL